MKKTPHAVLELQLNSCCNYSVGPGEPCADLVRRQVQPLQACRCAQAAAVDSTLRGLPAAELLLLEPLDVAAAVRSHLIPMQTLCATMSHETAKHRQAASNHLAPYYQQRATYLTPTSSTLPQVRTSDYAAKLHMVDLAGSERVKRR